MIKAENLDKQTKNTTRGIRLFMKTKFLLLLLTIFSLSIIVIGQDTESEEFSSKPVPENAMREVVRRILVYKFKPRNRKTIIYIAQKGISQNWLPEIQNIEFRLLTDEEVEDKGIDIYFFTKPELSKTTYEIGFGFGDPDCNHEGDTWRFRISKGKVKLWQYGGFGGICSGSFGEFENSGQLNTYPNEFSCCKFFDTGKLEGLKLTISTKEDVVSNFGEDCKSSCDYDQNWRIYFTYFNDFSSERTVDAKKIKLVAKPEYADKLYSIKLFPKSKVLFNKIVFPSKFKKDNVYSAAHGGSGGGSNSIYDVYEDRYGLEYTILREVSLTTVKNLDWQKGQLTSIEYKIPDKLKDEMFVEQE